MSGVKAQLPTNIGITGLQNLVPDPNWGFQRKYNGHRRTIRKEAGRIYDFNREGKPGTGLPKNVVNALLRHPQPEFLIDVEFVLFGGHNTIYVFDILTCNYYMEGTEEFAYREARYHAEFDNFDVCIIPVVTARTQDEKVAMFVQAAQDGCEGIVAHDMRAAYEEGRSNNVFKFKFGIAGMQTLDAVVLGASSKHKQSVRLGCYDEHGKLHEICGAKIIDFTPRRGDVVEVRYSKGTKNLHIMEIHMLRIRDDKPASQCTLDQIVVNEDFRR